MIFHNAFIHLPHVNHLTHGTFSATRSPNHVVPSARKLATLMPANSASRSSSEFRTASVISQKSVKPMSVLCVELEYSFHKACAWAKVSLPGTTFCVAWQKPSWSKPGLPTHALLNTAAHSGC